jgi:acyl-coenzyme A synthetase/AMP-(fatty) acid ligase
VLDDGERPPWSRDEHWIASSRPVAAELLAAAQQEVHPDDEAIVVYTSGQSAEPKGVVHTHGSVMTKVHYLRDMMQMDERTVEDATMPFFWVGGLVMHLLSALETGAVVVCTPRTSFGAHEIIGNAAQGDEPIDVALGMKAEPSLGMTETFGMYAWGHEGKGGRSTIAAPMDFFQPGMEVKVVDESGRPVGDGERGEILVRGVSVTRRLHKVDRSQAFDDDGFYRTGDEGLVDGDRIHFTGRLGDLVKTSGANVSPAEVERALLGLPEVAFATVVGVDDAERGQVVAAAIVVADGCEIDVDAIGERLRSELSPYKIPRRYLVLSSMAEIPMTPSLKVAKRELAARFAGTDGAGAPAS